ncbi:26S proteasome non-ATPase regulatory subunit 3 homolog A [Zea mays]|uniref:26S proteasome non-ATPase regulatory subunit 3 homolog A n=1 Tax=Zea mays TaxID=4577 RepID=A0A1D6KMZ6_MAIZE|nr:26S proteasome non-ATPase regulatory subunit 3 homolog A [Zea mays]
MPEDVQMNDSEPQSAAPAPAAAAAPALSTVRSEGDRVRDRGWFSVQGGPPDLPRLPPHRRAPPPPCRTGRLRLPRRERLQQEEELAKHMAEEEDDDF